MCRPFGKWRRSRGAVQVLEVDGIRGTEIDQDEANLWMKHDVISQSGGILFRDIQRIVG